jgi:hypothetical protein
MYPNQPPAYTEAGPGYTNHPDAGLADEPLPATPPRGTSIPNRRAEERGHDPRLLPPGSRSSSHLFFASFSYISMKEQLLQKSVKILSLESNKSNTTVGIQSGGNSRYFLFIKIDCLKIRKTRREHHINMCRRSELFERKKTRIASCARVILHMVS